MAAALLLAVIAIVIHPWLGAGRAPIELLDVTAELVVLALPGRRRVGEFLRVSLGWSRMARLRRVHLGGRRDPAGSAW